MKNKTEPSNLFVHLFIPHKLIFIFYAVFLIAGLFLGQYLSISTESIPKLQSLYPGSKEIRLNNGYKYTNPLLECETTQNSSEKEYKPSKNKVEEIINNKKALGEINDVAIYYRDLNNGPWFGINEKASFSPASLLKLPIMMAYFKKLESNPSFLDKKVTYEDFAASEMEYFKPQVTLKPGTSYTLLELIESMIKYSDNNALSLLGENIDTSAVNNVMSDLGIENVTESSPQDFMSVKSYATLFRVLYNASYLTRESSEKALQILSNVKFDKGIIQGLPKNIAVAHKFGERDLSNGTRQLHDCGIVYYPNHPYLLCIMTRGQEYEKMSGVIGDISKEIYSDINQKYKK
ncbi:class A beta-lactamase-related serine hydrolase [Patescibacteria group bacterium]|nr:class A beta-lactamase-related serine hydrolase [Patescibacteria group bacterium]